ncbi:MAG: hypothetical protein U1E36_03325 [Rickettsiales bacterium]
MSKPTNPSGMSLSADVPLPKEKPFTTAGTRIHKWGTYIGVDWIFNTASGVSFAYWGKFSESGQKYWSKPITGFFEKILKPFIKDPKKLETSAGRGNMFVGIIAGGMFTIPPLLVLENNKVRKSFAQFYDRMIYGKEKVDHDPEFQKAYEQIEQTPKKDFVNGMGARFVALTPLLAMVLNPKTGTLSKEYWFDYVQKASEGGAHALGLGLNKSFPKRSLEDAKSRWKFIHESIAMDFGLGGPYAALHAIFYDMFSGKKPETPNPLPAPVPLAPPSVSEPKLNIETPLPQINPVTGESLRLHAVSQQQLG